MNSRLLVSSSNRFGRRVITALGMLGAGIWVFVLFPATASANDAVVIGAAAVGGLCHGVIVGGMSPFFVELFPTSARYTGFSVGYQVASVFGGAIAPLIASHCSIDTARRFPCLLTLRR